MEVGGVGGLVMFGRDAAKKKATWLADLGAGAERTHHALQADNAAGAAQAGAAQAGAAQAGGGGIRAPRPPP